MCPAIPKQIIQTGKDRNLNSLCKGANTSLQLLHPGWKFILFDHGQVRAFIAREFPEYLAVFDGFPRLIQGLDFFRYLFIYRLGGFYLDLDVLLWANLEPLLRHACVFPFEELTLSRYLRRRCAMDWEIGNYAFGAKAGHPFLKAVIDNCVRAQRDPKWVAPMIKEIPRLFRPNFHVLNTTGAAMLSRTLAENPDLAGDVTVLFPEDVRDTKSWHHFGSFGIHLMEASWCVRGNYFSRRLSNLWQAWATRRGVAESYDRGKTRSIPIRCDGDRSSVLSSATMLPPAHPRLEESQR